LCARSTLTRSLLFLLTMTGLAAPSGVYVHTQLLDVPGELVDAEITGSGRVYLLMRGLPHLVVVSPDGQTSEFDLREIVIPGGICVDHGWGWYATGQVNDRLFRYDRDGELMDSWSTAELPGDVALAGLTLAYVSMGDGTIRSTSDPGSYLVRLSGSGDGQLSPLGERFVYSDGEESMTLGEFLAPQPLPATGIWASTGEDLAFLTDSCVCGASGGKLFEVPPEYAFRRISFSQGGAFCLLWSPGGERVLVLR